MAHYRRIIKILLCLTLFALTPLLLSADTSIPELEKKLLTASGNERIVVLNALSSAYLHKSPEKALKFANRALLLARPEKEAA